MTHATQKNPVNPSNLNLGRALFFKVSNCLSDLLSDVNPLGTADTVLRGATLIFTVIAFVGSVAS